MNPETTKQYPIDSVGGPAELAPISPVQIVLNINGELLDELNERILELARRLDNISANEVPENEATSQAMPFHGSSAVVSQIEIQREMIERTLGNVNRIISKLEV